jgi:hypothetical protein
MHREVFRPNLAGPPFRQRCASPGRRRSQRHDRHGAGPPFRACGSRHVLAGRPIRGDLQAHLAVARVVEQPPASTAAPLMLGTRMSAVADAAQTAAVVRGLGSLHREAETSRRERGPRRGGLRGASGQSGEPVSATRGSSPNSGGWSSYNTALACWWIAAARRRARRSQPRGDHAMPLAGGGIQQRGDDHFGPVAPVRHRPRRKQYVRLRARMAHRPPGPQWANGAQHPHRPLASEPQRASGPPQSGRAIRPPVHRFVITLSDAQRHVRDQNQ